MVLDFSNNTGTLLRPLPTLPIWLRAQQQAMESLNQSMNEFAWSSSQNSPSVEEVRVQHASPVSVKFDAAVVGERGGKIPDLKSHLRQIQRSIRLELAGDQDEIHHPTTVASKNSAQWSTTVPSHPPTSNLPSIQAPLPSIPILSSIQPFPIIPALSVLLEESTDLPATDLIKNRTPSLFADSELLHIPACTSVNASHDSIGTSHPLDLSGDTSENAHEDHHLLSRSTLALLKRLTKQSSQSSMTVLGTDEDLTLRTRLILSGADDSQEFAWTQPVALTDVKPLIFSSSATVSSLNHDASPRTHESLPTSPRSPTVKASFTGAIKSKLKISEITELLQSINSERDEDGDFFKDDFVMPVDPVTAAFKNNVGTIQYRSSPSTLTSLKPLKETNEQSLWWRAVVQRVRSTHFLYLWMNSLSHQAVGVLEREFNENEESYKVTKTNHDQAINEDKKIAIDREINEDKKITIDQEINEDKKVEAENGQGITVQQNSESLSSFLERLILVESIPDLISNDHIKLTSLALFSIQNSTLALTREGHLCSGVKVMMRVEECAVLLLDAMKFDGLKQFTPTFKTFLTRCIDHLKLLPTNLSPITAAPNSDTSNLPSRTFTLAFDAFDALVRIDCMNDLNFMSFFLEFWNVCGSKNCRNQIILSRLQLWTTEQHEEFFRLLIQLPNQIMWQMASNWRNRCAAIEIASFLLNTNAIQCDSGPSTHVCSIPAKFETASILTDDLAPQSFQSVSLQDSFEQMLTAPILSLLNDSNLDVQQCALRHLKTLPRHFHRCIFLHHIMPSADSTLNVKLIGIFYAHLRVEEAAACVNMVLKEISNDRVMLRRECCRLMANLLENHLRPTEAISTDPTDTDIIPFEATSSARSHELRRVVDALLDRFDDVDVDVRKLSLEGSFHLNYFILA